eukprot:TRINITY_DN89457_c0_g1_i2.p1 TRINITY_DN89457_c0_g1~~TRINITY_DN89457_c0_g1_i2.p1  ORF type:complete len:382 (+),score=45.89 TRINITY_DN89457_c0_g1_i2:116-1261(+)
MSDGNIIRDDNIPTETVKFSENIIEEEKLAAVEQLVGDRLVKEGGVMLLSQILSFCHTEIGNPGSINVYYYMQRSPKFEVGQLFVKLVAQDKKNQVLEQKSSNIGMMEQNQDGTNEVENSQGEQNEKSDEPSTSRTQVVNQESTEIIQPDKIYQLITEQKSKIEEQSKALYQKVQQTQQLVLKHGQRCSLLKIELQILVDEYSRLKKSIITDIGIEEQRVLQGYKDLAHLSSLLEQLENQRLFNITKFKEFGYVDKSQLVTVDIDSVLDESSLDGELRSSWNKKQDQNASEKKSCFPPVYSSSSEVITPPTNVITPPLPEEDAHQTFDKTLGAMRVHVINTFTKTQGDDKRRMKFSDKENKRRKAPNQFDLLSSKEKCSED